MKQRGLWKTKFGFYLAAIGTAFGLGNLWRFPYIVGENGGGAFVLLYVMLALLLGLPLLIGELVLGKSARRSILSASKELEAKSKFKTSWIGVCSIILCLVVFSYYAVISGWVLYFFVRFAVGEGASSLSALQGNGLLQLGLASVHILFAVIVVLRGVQDGMERFVGAMTPIFTLLLVFLISRTLSLPSTVEQMKLCHF